MDDANARTGDAIAKTVDCFGRSVDVTAKTVDRNPRTVDRNAGTVDLIAKTVAHLHGTGDDFSRFAYNAAIREWCVEYYAPCRSPQAICREGYTTEHAMPGILLLTDPDWQAFQVRASVGRLAVFYASLSKRTARAHLDPLFCVRPGSLPRPIVAVGRIQAQAEIHQDAAWAAYGSQLGAPTEAEWREQAESALEKSRKNFEGRMLAIELVDFKEFPAPVFPRAVGLRDDGWQKVKQIDDAAVAHLMTIVDGPGVVVTAGEAARVGAGFGSAEHNAEVETAAVNAVKAHYQERHWQVESVEGQNLGYDLRCTKPAVEQHVEVKGASGAVESFPITAGEVKKSLADPQWIIAVVTSALSDQRKITMYSAADFHARFSLSVISYMAKLRPPAGA